MTRNATLEFGLLLVSLIAVSGCSGAAATAPAVDRPPDVAANPAEFALAQSANSDFAVDLYAQLAQEHPGENLFFSPFSVSSALLIATEGASGETADQMGQVLHVPKSLRNTGPDAASLPWQLAGLHKGQAAIYYRLSPEPVAPELAAKIARLRSDLDAANRETIRLGDSDNWRQANASQSKAKKLADELNPILEQTEPYEWRAANALWAEKTYPFRQSYLDTIHTYYGSVAMPVDFRGNTEAARKQINDWVAGQTHDRIEDLMGPGSVDDLTRLVITNAVYFKGVWLQPFDVSSTRPKDFHLADGKTVSTPMMSKYMFGSAGYGAFNGDGTQFNTPTEIPVEMSDDDPSLYPDAHGFTATRLPYKGGKLFMAIIVPRSADGLASLEKQLPRTGLRKWLDGIGDRTVVVDMPRFKLATEYSLKESLQSLGMVRAFRDAANGDGPRVKGLGGAQFDRMTASDDPANQLYISAVRHKAYVEVNEKGTEAAAATSVAMEAKSAVPFERPKTRPFIPKFRADKPFLFAICDNETQSILFLGRIVEPRSP